jgi:branched-chain amino acid transport system substrate-binding protein
VAVGLLTVTAACSGSGSNRNADIGNAAKKVAIKCGLSNGKKATGAPIKIGAIATESGGLDFSSAPRSAQAFFDCVNANGGINGRPIEYDVQDDGLDPQKASALATKFADDSSVVAMTGGASFVACTTNQPIFAKANLYDILAVGVPKPCFYSKNMTPVNGGPRLSFISDLQQLKNQFHIKSIGATAYSIPGLGDWLKDGLQAWAKQAGVQIKFFDETLPPVKDPATIIAKIRSAKPDAYVPTFAAPDVAAVLKAAAQQNLGSAVHFGCLTPCYDTTFPSQIGAYWRDKFYSNSEFGLVDSTGADNLNWRAILNKYGSSSDPRDSFSQAGYLAAKILVTTLLKLDPKHLDRATVSKAITSIKNFRSDLMCTPWYFTGPNGHDNPNHQLHNVKLGSGGKYVQAAGCFETPDPGLSDILAAEKSDPSLIGR